MMKAAWMPVLPYNAGKPKREQQQALPPERRSGAEDNKKAPLEEGGFCSADGET